jgi:glutaminyl-peptide cyclotransferase
MSIKKIYKLKKNNTLGKVAIVFIFVLSVGFSCRQTGHKPKNGILENNQELVKKNLNFITPQEDQVFKIGQDMLMKLKFTDTAKQPDSVKFMADSKPIMTVRKISEPVTWNTQNAKAGAHNIEVIAFYAANISEQVSIQVRLVSGSPAQIYSYTVRNTYPHDANAYTQGLIYNDNCLFEGTGLYGQSTLRKVKLNTGEILKVFNLPSNVFGEGITTFNNKIIQITWREQVAFLYDKESFSQLNKFYYPMKEGWGITNDGTNLIMSDGSATLYFLDKEYFTEVGRLEVCDDKGPVERLNELEYIEGEIWANVYTTDTIVRINPKNGVVTGKIDMSGLLKPADRAQNSEVLNGIAYDLQGKKIFVTGKNWPKLFEITVQQKHR